MDHLNATAAATIPSAALLPQPGKRKIKVIVIGPHGGGVRKTKAALAVA